MSALWEQGTIQPCLAFRFLCETKRNLLGLSPNLTVSKPKITTICMYILVIMNCYHESVTYFMCSNLLRASFQRLRRSLSLSTGTHTNRSKDGHGKDNQRSYSCLPNHIDRLEQQGNTALSIHKRAKESDWGGSRRRRHVVHAILFPFSFSLRSYLPSHLKTLHCQARCKFFNNLSFFQQL